jgi:uncharacterized protein DUF5667
MTWGFRAQRRADDFDALVEQLSTGEERSVGDPREAELLELVGALRAVPDPAPRAEFVADLRSRLMAEAATALVPTDVSKLRLPARRTARERRIAALVGGLAVVGATTSVAMAAQSALPGESLYPIKRVIESAHTGLSLGDASRGRTELSIASGRLDEVAALTEDSGPAADQRIEQTLSTFTDQATAGADLLLADYAHTGRTSSIAHLRDFASSSIDQLSDLEPQIPYAARDELIAAASTLAQIDNEAAEQCPTCGGTPITVIPPSLVASEQITVPGPSDAPTAQADQPAKGPKGTQPTPSAGASNQPQLPNVGAGAPPGSVLDPGAATPSGSPNPLKTLTDGLTGALTGQGATGGSGSGGTTSSTPSAPITQVVEGIDGLLHSVLDPITGQLLPSSAPTLP